MVTACKYGPCGITFEPLPGKRYCSRECKERACKQRRLKRKAIVRRLARPCKGCGGPIWDERRHKFCSAECFKRFVAEVYRPAYVAPPRVPRHCVTCGGVIAGNGIKYCSKQCAPRPVRPSREDSRRHARIHYLKYRNKVLEQKRAYGVAVNAAVDVYCEWFNLPPKQRSPFLLSRSSPILYVRTGFPPNWHSAGWATYVVLPHTRRPHAHVKERKSAQDRERAAIWRAFRELNLIPTNEEHI